MSDRIKTYGHGDPVLAPSLLSLHDAAEARGEAMYLDPELGLWVQTRSTLRKNGQCCGRTCRHCPYERAEQMRAGREILREEGAPGIPGVSGAPRGE